MPSASPPDLLVFRPRRAPLLRRATFAALTVAALIAHPRLGGEVTAGVTTTFTRSTSTSSETQTTNATVRVDTAATRLVVIDPIGGLVSDQTLPVPFADAAVQAAIVTAQAALLAAQPASLVAKGPALVDTSVALIGSSTSTIENSRDTTLSNSTEPVIGPACLGIGDRDEPNTTPCEACGLATGTVPPSGVPYCVLAGSTNVNTNTNTHAVIHQTQTTTDTYVTTERYLLRGSFLDHFVLYKVKSAKGTPAFAAFGPVTLTDAVGGADYDVTKLPALGLPADKNTEGRADPTTHLAQYAVKRRKGAAKFVKIPDVAVANQCGGLVLTIVKPESLLVPVAQNPAGPAPPLGPHEVDHLLCYKANVQKTRSDGIPVATRPKGTQVDGVDGFQTRRYDLKKVTRLCVPVSTAGTPVTKTGTTVPLVASAVRHPIGHLVCYQAKVAKKSIPQNGCGPVDPKSKGTKILPTPPKHQPRLAVHIDGPLGAATLDTAKEVELCIPSTATLP